jgi:DNA-directed RNA polymerase specialized sigma24 family protein
MACDADRSLAPVYREALRLRAEGCDDVEIAAALDITVEAVPSLLLLAERKLRRIRGEDDAVEP